MLYNFPRDEDEILGNRNLILKYTENTTDGALKQRGSFMKNGKNLNLESRRGS